jgi:hypothetical protein
MTRILDPKKLGLKPREAPQEGPRILSPADVQWLGVEPDTVARIPIPKGSDSIFLETPDYNELVSNTFAALREAGFDETTIRNIVQPGGLGKIEDPLDWPHIYEILRPGFEDSAAAAYETWRQAENLKEEGIELDPKETAALRSLLLAFVEEHGSNAVNTMANSSKWWRRMKRRLAESTAGEIAARGALEFGVGLASLDFFVWLNKKQKLPFIPAEQRADVEARILPRIVLEDHEGKAREFTQGTTAAWWLNRQRLKGLGMIGLSHVNLSDPLARVQASTRGMQMIQNAQQEIPTLLAALGEHITWQEIAERNLDHADPGAVDDVYKMAYDMGRFGEIGMLGVSLGTGLSEIFGDLTVLASGLPTRIGRVGAPIARIVGRPGKAALQAEKIARTTQRFQDALDNLAESQRHFKRMEQIGEAQRKGPKGRMSTEQARRIVLARKQVKNAESFVDTFKDPDINTSDVLLPRTPRRRPELLPEDDVLDTITDSQVAKKELAQARKDELRRDIDVVGAFDDQDPAAIQQRLVLGPDDAEQAGDALNHMVRTGGVGMDDVAVTPQAVEYQRFPDTRAGLTKFKPIDDAGMKMPTEEEFGSLIKFAKSDLSKRTIRTLLRDLQKTRKSLGEARNRKAAIVDPKGRTTLEVNKVTIKRLEDEMANLKKLAKDLSKQDFFSEATKYDDIWLPGSQDPMLANPSRFTRWLEEAGDRVVEGLYPGSLMLHTFWNTKTGQAFAWLREPLRFYDTYDPATSEVIRGSFLRHKRFVDASSEMIASHFERAGIIAARKGKWNLKKHWKPYKYDPESERAQQFWELMDTSPSDPKYAVLRGQADQKILDAHDDIRRIMDEMADLQGIPKGTDDYLEGYIRHVFPPEMFAGNARPMELIGLPAKAEVFVGHLLSRKGMAGYTKDPLLALDIYLRAASRKIHLEPMYETVLGSGERLAKQHNNPMFSQYANMLVNHLKGKPSFVGELVDRFLGGPFQRLTSPAQGAGIGGGMGAIAGGIGGGIVGMPTIGAAVGTGIGAGLGAARVRWGPAMIDRYLVGLTGLFWSGTLAGNPRYPIMQMATGAITTSSRFGLFRTSKGLWQMATPEGQALAKQIGVYEEFLDIFESPAMKRFSTMMTEIPAITPVGIVSTKQTEFMIRGASALAAIDLYLNKLGFATLDEAFEAGFGKRVLFEALRGAEETNHMYGPLGRSPVFSALLPRGAVVSGTQFLSFIPKQTEELLAQFQRNPGSIVQYLALSGWLSRVAAEEFGIDLTKYVGLGYMPEGGDELTSPAVSTFLEGLNMLSAIGSHNPEKATKAMARFQENLDNLIPTMVAWETIGKGARRLQTGEARAMTGEKLRNLDFKRYLIGKDKITLEDVGTAIRPGIAAPRPGQPAPGLGGDIIPTLTGQRNLRDELFRRGRQQILATEREHVFKTRNAARELVQALLEKDQERIADARANLNRLILNDELRITTDDPFEAAMEAYMIGWGFRELDRNKKYADEIYQMLTGAGMEIAP